MIAIRSKKGVRAATASFGVMLAFAMSAGTPAFAIEGIPAGEYDAAAATETGFQDASQEGTDQPGSPDMVGADAMTGGSQTRLTELEGAYLDATAPVDILEQELNEASGEWENVIRLLDAMRDNTNKLFDEAKAVTIDYNEFSDVVDKAYDSIDAANESLCGYAERVSLAENDLLVVEETLAGIEYDVEDLEADDVWEQKQVLLGRIATSKEHVASLLAKSSAMREHMVTTSNEYRLHIIAEDVSNAYDAFYDAKEAAESATNSSGENDADSTSDAIDAIEVDENAAADTATEAATGDADMQPVQLISATATPSVEPIPLGCLDETTDEMSPCMDGTSSLEVPAEEQAKADIILGETMGLAYSDDCASGAMASYASPSRDEDTDIESESTADGDNAVAGTKNPDVNSQTMPAELSSPCKAAVIVCPQPDTNTFGIGVTEFVTDSRRRMVIA